MDMKKKEIQSYDTRGTDLKRMKKFLFAGIFIQENMQCL